MTSLPVVPSKFYQVCRLCLTVVSNTNDLMNLSVFGGHNAGCIGTNATSTQIKVEDSIVTASTNTTNNSSGVIVKTNQRNEAQISSPSNEQYTANNSVTNNANDNEAATGDGVTRGGDDDNNNFKIDGDLHHSDVLERIYTFLSITVSGQILYSLTNFYSSIFFFSLSCSSKQKRELLIVFYCY